MAERVEPRLALHCDTDQEAVTIMVHGTFSSASEDTGDRWWQSGSPTARKLQSLVPSFIHVAKREEVFHWSGDNSERSRSKAATKLLRHVRSLDEQGTDYHLVGHSHGGSIIWKALQMSVLKKEPLQRLRSWTTIGTPFMQHRSRGTLSVMNLNRLIIGLALLIPAMAAPKALVSSLYNIAAGNRTAIVLEPDHAVGYGSILREPVLATIEGLGIAVSWHAEGIQVGSFDPAGSQSLAQYFLATSEGLMLLGFMIGLTYLFVHFCVLCISPAIEKYRIRFEQRLHRIAFEVYGARWLGIWSPDDEAINGLRATLNSSVSFVGKMVPREVVYLSDIFALPARPYYWLLAPIYNRFVHPTVDDQIRNIVVRAAQGSDRPTATLVDVTASPVVDAAFEPPPIPALLNLKLLSYANKHAHELVPKLRGLIAQNSFMSGLEAFGEQLSGKELVHTAYFEQEEVLKLIAANMTWTADQVSSPRALQSMPCWLRKWFIAYKKGVGTEQTVRLNAVTQASIQQDAGTWRKTA